MITEILSKKPFARVTPEGYLQGKITSDLRNASFSKNNDKLVWQIISQADFIREFYPSGHKINSEIFYPNKLKYDEKTERFFEEKVFRASFPFQMIITIQQLVHLCGNDIHHELTDTKMKVLGKHFLSFKRGGLIRTWKLLSMNTPKA
jgi:hypothetical protein